MCNTMNGRKTGPEPLDRSQLEKLRSDADSCVEVKKSVENLSIHPFHLSNFANSIKEILNERIAKYSIALDGILLGFDHVKTLGSKAPVYDDMFNMFHRIEADFYVFKPTLGCTLNGIVNKKFKNDIGCLVHKVFNVSLPKPTDSDDWLGFKAQIGQEVQFKVTFMQLNAELPYIRGELLSIISEDSGISTSDEVAAPKNNKVKKFTEANAEDDDPEAETESEKKKKLKKKKKIAESEETQDAKVKSPKKKSKKDKKEKKAKESKSTEHESDNDDNEPQEQPEAMDTCELVEDLLDQKKKKKKEKPKEKPTSDCTSVEATNESENKKNKKDKKDKKHKKEKKEKKEKNKTRIDTEEKDILDETLPDLNLDVLFDSMHKDSDNESPAFSQNIVLPADSDMEEVLKDIPKKDKKEKKEKKEKSPKKRKLEDVENENVATDDEKVMKDTPKKDKKEKKENKEKSSKKRKLEDVENENVATDDAAVSKKKRKRTST